MSRCNVSARNAATRMHSTTRNDKPICQSYENHNKNCIFRIQCRLLEAGTSKVFNSMHRRSTYSSVFLTSRSYFVCIEINLIENSRAKKISGCARDRCNWIRNSMSVITIAHKTQHFVPTDRPSGDASSTNGLHFNSSSSSSAPSGDHEKNRLRANKCSGSVPCALEQVCRCKESCFELRDTRSSANWNMEKLFNHRKWKKSHTNLLNTTSALPEFQ